MTQTAAHDWYINGPPCLNCGERVSQSDYQAVFSMDGIVFEGKCRSSICRKLPPGGNPFTFILSRGEEE